MLLQQMDCLRTRLVGKPTLNDRSYEIGVSRAGRAICSTGIIFQILAAHRLAKPSPLYVVRYIERQIAVLTAERTSRGNVPELAPLR